MFPEVIETDRLRLERFDAAVDPTTFYAVAGAGQSDTVVAETEYVTWSPHAHLKESADVIEQFRDGWTDHETATYAVIPREGEEGAGTLAGNTGLGIEWNHRRGLPGIWLRKPFWGRRYSGERAGALAALAFERLDLEVLAVDVLVGNEQSQRAVDRYIDRLGGRRTGRLRNQVTTADDTVHDVIRWSVTREEYREAAPNQEPTFQETLDESRLTTE
ncbi:GNAT family N-acetyltransferase [Halosegnis sp.]|uniref:GNAT family N-acetyltransferase n=1 Tax=Halosegnis sp. TaxID=2864959 RepID=UPI0035D486B1